MVKFFAGGRSPGPVEAEIADEMAFSGDGVADGKQKAEVFGEFVESPEICEGCGPAGIGSLTLGKNFAAQCKMLVDIALEQPAGEKIIALPGLLVYRISAASVSCPRPPGFLRPDGELCPCPAVAETPVRVTG